MHEFTRILVMVELDGLPYGVDIPSDGLEKMLMVASALSKSKTLELAPMPNQKSFDSVFEKVEK